MQTREIKDFLTLMTKVLKHMETVQRDIMKFSESSTIIFYRTLEKNNLPLDEEQIRAVQYQDIVSQQLNALCTSVEMIEKSFNEFVVTTKRNEDSNEHLHKLFNELESAYDIAKHNQKVFGGDALEKEREGSLEFL